MDDEKNRLDDGTPAQMAGIQIKQQNKWLELTQNASRKIGQEKCLYFSVSDLLFPLVASILKSGKSSRITSLMRSWLGFLGRSTLNPLLNFVYILRPNALYKRICVLEVIYP